MNAQFENRLNQILPKLLSPSLLRNEGQGKDIGFWIFDYPPEREIEMRLFLHETIETRLVKTGVRFIHINVFDLLIKHLQEQGLLEAVFDMQLARGDEITLQELRPIFAEADFSRLICKVAQPNEQDIVLLSGIGSAYPILRSHTLLNSLHAPMGDTPLVMFYPGKYDGLSLKLFNNFSEDNYYRAFPLAN